MTTLHDAVVLVTGANGGLGREFVDQALARGAAKVYASARNPQTWTDSRVVPLALDITDEGSIEAAAKAADDTTVLINNAGISGPGPVLTSSLQDLRALFETNVFGQVALVQALAPTLAANGGGAIIDVHSALSWLATGGTYSASKAAFWSLTNSLRLELHGQGTQVVGAHLGYTDTPMTVDVTAPKGDPADVVAAIYDGLESGAHEVLADETSHRVRGALSGPLEALYPSIA
ncbi:SDR family oxidoreductase [Cellulomonas sp. P5_E12]